MLAAACGPEADNNTNNVTANNTTANNTTANNTTANNASQATLALSSTDLPELGDGYVYEGWLIVEGAPDTTGRFDATAGGGVDETFEVSADDLAAAAKFVLTIEPAEGDDPGRPR